MVQDGDAAVAKLQALVRIPTVSDRDPAKVDEAANRGLREVDRNKRIGIYQELARYIHAQPMATITLGWLEGWFFRDNRVKGYVRPLGSTDSNTMVRVWLGE